MVTRVITLTAVCLCLSFGGPLAQAAPERLVPRDGIAGEVSAAGPPVGAPLRATSGPSPIVFEPDDAFPTSADEPVSVAAGDVTGDGLVDVVATTEQGVVNVFEQGADGSLDPATPYATTSTTYGDYGVDVGDLDGDGDLDVAVALPQGADWFEQDGGTLLPAVHLSSTSYGNHALIADLDGDDLGDIVVAGDQIELWLNSETGFSVSELTGVNPDETEVGDVTGDGTPDIVAAYADRVAVFEGTGTGTFDDPARYRTSTWVNAIALGDGNDDGRLDVMAVVGGNADSKMNYFRQTTAGTLAQRIVYESKDIPDNADVVDMNADGRDDLVVGHGVWVTFGVYLQRADGTFADERLYPTDYHNYEPKGIATDDVNGDGKPDVIFADFTGQVHAWRQARQLTMVAPKKVQYREDIPWTATLADPGTTDNDTLNVYEVIDGIPHMLTSGVVAPDGTFSGTYENAKENVELRVEWDGDSRSAFVAETVEVRVAVDASGALTGFYATAGGYRLYREGTVPVYLGRVKPIHEGVGLDFRLQRRTDSGWANVSTARVKMNADGLAGVEILGVRAGTSYRIRCEFRSDADHAGDVAPWAYLRVKG